jgi:NAD+ diphosphatase
VTRELEQPSLSRSTLDRAAHRRAEQDLLAGLLGRADTLVLELDGDRTPVVETPGGVRLALRPAGQVRPDPQALLVFLGQSADGAAHLVRVGPGSIGPGEHLATLREVGAVLNDTDAGLFTAALSLANWHAAHPRCSRCGQPTQVALSGWSRRCPGCSAEHHPRTDPAVIMAVVDPDDRVLLGRQASWPPRRFSTLAGFVEPGESLEQAVRREVAEESGVRVGRVAYQGSQPWPFPSSLMLAFTAAAVTTQITVDGAELAQARWWSREELALDVATEELLLPPPVSIARRLIEHWYGSPIRDGGGAWR